MWFISIFKSKSISQILDKEYFDDMNEFMKNDEEE